MLFLKESKMIIKDYDDKDLVIVAVFALCVLMIIIDLPTSKDLIGNAIAGLFGVAVGKSLK